MQSFRHLCALTAIAHNPAHWEAGQEYSTRALQVFNTNETPVQASHESSYFQNDVGCSQAPPHIQNHIPHLIDPTKYHNTVTSLASPGLHQDQSHFDADRPTVIWDSNELNQCFPPEPKRHKKGSLSHKCPMKSVDLGFETVQPPTPLLCTNDRAIAAERSTRTSRAGHYHPTIQNSSSSSLSDRIGSERMHTCNNDYSSVFTCHQKRSPTWQVSWSQVN